MTAIDKNNVLMAFYSLKNEVKELYDMALKNRGPIDMGRLSHIHNKSVPETESLIKKFLGVEEDGDI